MDRGAWGYPWPTTVFWIQPLSHQIGGCFEWASAALRLMRWHAQQRWEEMVLRLEVVL